MDSVTIQPSVGEFRHSLTSCCGDCTLCCIGFLCPNCLAFCAAQSAGEGMLSSVCNCLLYPFCLCCLRSTVREKRAIDGSCCGDLMTTLCCPCCGYIQIKSFFHCLCYPLCCLRTKVREERGIDGSCCGDVMISLCCPCCGYIQIKREFKGENNFNRSYRVE